MTAALVVVAVVALLAIVALVLMARRDRARLDSERARAARLEAQVRVLEEAASASTTSPAPAEPAVPADEAEPQPAAAPTPADVAPEPPTIAAAPDEPTAAPDEPTIAAATEPTPTTAGAPDEPAERLDTNSHGGVAAEPLLDLERLRLEREWGDIVGASTPLPVPWDGSVRGVVAVELDIIREVIGTPSRIEPPTISSAAEPAVAVATARLATEILRRLAKAGEEITVTFATDNDVTMAIAVEGEEVTPDLSDLTTTAAELGGRLSFRETDAGFEAQLRVPSLRSEPSSAETQPDSRPS